MTSPHVHVKDCLVNGRVSCLYALRKQPRVIRKVIKMGRDGKPKIARDRKAHITMERVVAKQEHECFWKRCPHDTIIEAGTAYARVHNGERMGYGRTQWPLVKAYHFECVPPAAKRLVRFLT